MCWSRNKVDDKFTNEAHNMLRCDEEEIIAAVFPWDWIDVTRDTRVKERTVRVWQKENIQF